MSTFRPPAGPQQPATYYTPGQPLGVPKAVTWQQQAAYQRDRIDIAHLLQRMQPIARATAALPLGVPAPNTWQQQAAYQLPRFHDRPMFTEIEETLTLFSAPLAASAPMPYRWDQQAAYQRDRVELAHLIRPIPLATAAQSLGAPLPYLWAQGAAYQRDRLAIEYELQPVPFATAAQALGVPPPRSLDQFPALRREVPAALQVPVNFVPPPLGGVRYVPIALPARARADDAAVLDEPLAPFFAAGLPLGVPPPRSMDQSAAYQRYPASPTQIAVSFVAAPVQFVPYAPFVLPLRARGDDLAVLDEVLPAFSILTVTPGVPPARTQDQSAAYLRAPPSPPPQLSIFAPPPSSAAYMAPAPLLIPAVARRDETAALEEVLPPFAPPLSVSVPPPIAQPVALYQRDAILPQQPRAGVIPPAPAPSVPIMRLQMPQMRPDQWPVWQLPLRPRVAPSFAPLAFYRGEVITVPDDGSHFRLRADSWRMTTLPDQTRFELQVDNWRITVSFNDYRFTLKPRKPS